MRFTFATFYFVALGGMAGCGGLAESDGLGSTSSPVHESERSNDSTAGPASTDDPSARVASEAGAPAPAVSAPAPGENVRPTPFPWLANCPAAPTDPWVSAAPPTGTIADLQAYATGVRAEFVGHWVGEQSIFDTTPNVAFSFESNGHYSGQCLDTGCWATIYYRTDNESPLKLYRLPEMSLDGVLSGTIDLVFPAQPAMGEDPSDPPYVPVSGTNVLKNVVLDATGNRLRFDLVSYMQAPPFVAHYDLHRCP